MTKRKLSEFLRDEMNIFLKSFGQRSQEENLSLEMCIHEFSLNHALLSRSYMI